MSPPEIARPAAATRRADRRRGDLSRADERAAFRQIGERPRYTAELLRVVTGTFVGPDGFTFERDIVRTFDAVCVVPLESDRDHVLLVRQYRAAVDRPLLELPAGKLDVPGEAPEVCAARELAEEVGAEAGRLTELGQLLQLARVLRRADVLLSRRGAHDAATVPRTGSRRSTHRSSGSRWRRSRTRREPARSPTPRRSSACCWHARS